MLGCAEEGCAGGFGGGKLGACISGVRSWECVGGLVDVVPGNMGAAISSFDDSAHHHVSMGLSGREHGRARYAQECCRKYQDYNSEERNTSGTTYQNN